MTTTIETDRLILRPPILADLHRWVDLMADPVVAQYIGGVQPPSMVWRGIMTIAGSWQLTGVGMFSVVEKATDQWIGRVGPWCPLGWPGTEVGWALRRDAWGKGFAVEAARATMDYAVDTLGWTDIIHSISPANKPSQRVAERLGSVNRGPGTLPAPYEHDEIDIWGQTSEEWMKRVW